MSHSAEISRSNPTALMILLDQSSSMSDPFAGGADSKAVEAARVVNRFLAELTIKCAKADGIRDYYSVGVIGYGANIGNAFGGALASEGLQPISVIGDNPLRLDQLTKKVPDGAGGLVEQQVDFPIWVEPIANGATPMCQALNMARDLLAPWVQDHPNSYPPTVLNITDGEANDGDPLAPAKVLQELSTNDGSLQIYNCHVSSSNEKEKQYPASDQELGDQYARLLFAMSSELTPLQLELARSEGFAVLSASRGFVFNADLGGLINFVNIGTRSTLR